MFDSFDFSQTFFFHYRHFILELIIMCILNVKTKSQNMTVKNKEFVFENYYERILKKIAIICWKSKKKDLVSLATKKITGTTNAK